MALSDAAKEALVKIVQQFDARNTAEFIRWGQYLKGGIDVMVGEDSFAVCRDIRTIHSLTEDGLITSQVTVEEFSNDRRKGSFGRVLPGTKRVTSTNVIVRPTDKGREAFKRFVR